MLESRCFTVRDVAKMWNCAVGQVYKLLRSGELNCFRVGDAIRIRPSDLLAYERAHETWHDPDSPSPEEDASSGRARRAGTSPGPTAVNLADEVQAHRIARALRSSWWDESKT